MNVISKLESITLSSQKRKVLWQDADLIEAPNWLSSTEFIVNSKGKMYRVDVSAQQKSEINTGFAQNCNNDHGISPDRKSLVISSHDTDENDPEDWKTSKIYILPIQGGEPKLVTENDCLFWHGWSPDGERLAYTANRNNEWDIYSISVNGGGEERLTTAKGHADGADYSPDGKFIYYNAYSSGYMEIWRMNVDGTNHQQITNDKHSNWFPHPSPDGKYLVYLCYLNDQKEDHPFGQDVKLRLLDLASRKISDLTQVFYGGQGTINVNSWSPDSTQFAFMSYVKS